MTEERIYFKNQGEKIEGILHSPDNKAGPLIILVHGFTGSKDGPDGLFVKLAEELVLKNFAVLRFNFRFTTEDFNEFYKMTIKGEVSDLKLIIDEMSKKYSKIGLIGESMGGAISILSYDERIKCLVLWYPTIFIRETDLGKRFLSEETAQELEKTGFVKEKKSNGREFVEELKKIEVTPCAKNIRSPTLIIHGENDKVVPFNQSERLLKILECSKKLEKIKGVCHTWKNEDFTTDYNFQAQQKAIKLTIKWFEKWLSYED